MDRPDSPVPPQGRPFPRLLILSPQAFNSVTGTGITFSNLFRGWPKDRLACIHCDDVPVTDEICGRYYRLGRNELSRCRPVGAVGAAAAMPPRPSALRAGARLAKSLLVGRALPDHGSLTPELAAWIADFRPEILYTPLGTLGMLDLIEAAADRFRLPMAVHFMDDWAEAMYRGGLLGGLLGAWMRRRLARLVDRAEVRLGIGEAMCQAYRGRYGHTFIPFQNTIDAAGRLAASKPPRPTGGPARLLYVGSIFDNAQLGSLEDCCRAVAALADAGRDLRLDILSPRHLAEPFRPRLEIHPAIRLGDTITDDEAFFAAIGAADILLLPSNFDADSVRLIRYSMPTKLPAYLVAGTPILAYGHPEAAQVSYLRGHHAAEVVDRPGVNELTAAMARLLDDTGLRRRLVDNAARLALANHDRAQVRRRFQETLAAAAKGRGP